MSRINKYMAGDCLIKTTHQTQGLSPSPSLGRILCFLLCALAQMLPQSPLSPRILESVVLIAVGSVHLFVPDLLVLKWYVLALYSRIGK